MLRLPEAMSLEYISTSADYHYLGKWPFSQATVDFDSFQANDEKVFVVIRALEVVGEAVKFLPRTERERYPQIPWQAVAGMRHKLIQGNYCSKVIPIIVK